jgi:DNA-binding NarL/FixJ family response regulator
MDRSTRILIVARPGHSRQSLVALLKTLQYTELFLTEGTIEAINQSPPAKAPHLVLIDLGGLHPLGDEVLKRAAQEWPAARKMALVDDIRHIDLAYALGMDCAMTHNTPAGELLHAVRQLSQETQAPSRMSHPASAFVTI